MRRFAIKNSHSTRLLNSRGLLLPGFIVAALLSACLSLLWSITLGAAEIDRETVFAALLQPDETEFEHLIIQTVRLPRVLAGVLVGIALAVAGAIMQALTRNPLADSGILGINAGAAFAVVVIVFLLRVSSLGVYALAGMMGAAAAGVLVYGLGSAGRGGPTPLRLTLAGVIVTCLSRLRLTTLILISDRETLDQIRFWTAGSLAGRDMPLLMQMAPIILSRHCSARYCLVGRSPPSAWAKMCAKGLGQNTVVIKVLSSVIVVALAGGAVALAGPIGFVGLVAPHIARFIVGPDYRWVIPYSGVLGGVMVVVADVAARIVLRPQEIPVGVMMALVGAPFLHLSGALAGAALMSKMKPSAKASWITVGQGRWLFSLKIDRRVPPAALVILAVTFAVLVLSISYGAYDISVSEVVQTLIRTLPDDHPEGRSFNLVVFTFRLPRILDRFPGGYGAGDIGGDPAGHHAQSAGGAGHPRRQRRRWFGCGEHYRLVQRSSYVALALRRFWWRPAGGHNDLYPGLEGWRQQPDSLDPHRRGSRSDAHIRDHLHVGLRRYP